MTVIPMTRPAAVPPRPTVQDAFDHFKITLFGGVVPRVSIHVGLFPLLEPAKGRAFLAEGRIQIDHSQCQDAYDCLVTLIHEMAHFVDYSLRGTSDHDAPFIAVMAQAGIDFEIINGQVINRISARAHQEIQFLIDRGFVVPALTWQERNALIAEVRTQQSDAARRGVRKMKTALSMMTALAMALEFALVALLASMTNLEFQFIVLCWLVAVCLMGASCYLGVRFLLKLSKR